MLKKSQKQDIIKDLKDRLEKQKIVIFTDFHGTSVAKAKTLRRSVKKENAEYKVAKKTLIDIALKESGLDAQTKELKGELGVLFGYGDQVAPAKALVKFGKEVETFKILGGILDGKVLSDKEVIALARLPSREILLAQLIGVLQGPIRGLVTVLSAPQRNLVVTLNQIHPNT